MWQILAIVYDSKHLIASFEILNETLTTRLRSIATQSTLNFRLVFQLSKSFWGAAQRLVAKDAEVAIKTRLSSPPASQATIGLDRG